MTSYYAWFLIFALILYLVLMDANVSYAFLLTFRILKIRYVRTKWWILNNPRNPIVKYFIWRNSLKIAKELEKEFKK